MLTALPQDPGAELLVRSQGRPLREEDMVVDIVLRLQPDVVGMSVWSTYHRLAARLSDRIKAAVDPVVVWGGIHAQAKPQDCLAHADVVCLSEGEYVLAELTDHLVLDQPYDDLRGCWVRSELGAIKNAPRTLIPDLDVLPPTDLSPDNKYYLGRDEWLDVARWNERALSTTSWPCAAAGSALTTARQPEQLRWDVAYTLAVHGVPRAVLHRLLDGRLFMERPPQFAQLARRVQVVGRAKDRILDRLRGRPNTYQLLVDNTNRLRGDDLSIRPNVGHSPFAKPIRQPSQTIPLPMAQTGGAVPRLDSPPRAQGATD